MSEPGISVIIPVGRVDEDLGLQLEALAGQTFGGRWELVISLNSDDPDQRVQLDRLLDTSFGSEAAVDVTIADSSQVRSASHARNVGASAASGTFLLFCDGDDIADREWMAQMVNALAPGRAIGGHLDEDLLAIPGQGDWRPPATPGALPTFLGHPFLVSANMGLSRADFERVGGFDTSLIRGEDIAFSWDLIELGVELEYRAEAVIHYRHRKGLKAMMQQHYLYGRGFSQILARRGLPGQVEGSTGLGSLRPNGQAVARKNLPYFLRRGSIAAGRVVGLVYERVDATVPRNTGT